MDESPKPTPKADVVCFRSAFAYESAPKITHATLDGERTLCGRKNWETSEGWCRNIVACLTCERVLSLREKKGDA